ncbi:MAG: (deoxy)nucleoside triphosphate pyrophosphohydrolase [Alphaproteobacteria bacterium]|nr:(deoxy)nucleoside triphosphate pyrophosphohydrolase [Alphaproteobacteria bacterium]
MSERIRVVAAAILQGGRVLCALRSPTMSTPDRWELPGGKVEPGESDARALVREIREELGVDIEVGGHIGTSVHGRIELVAYVARLRAGVPRPTEHAEVRWVGPDALHTLQWAPADVPLLGPLRDTVSAEGTP